MAKKVKINHATLSEQELLEKLKETTLKYNTDKIQNAITSLENPKSLPFMRKEIARIKTELRKRELSK